MNIDPRHLEIVAAVVSTGKLTDAAQLLGKSQPSLSRSLAELEKRIGSPLFEPGRRPLQPTEFGKALAETGQRILDARKDAVRLVTRHRSGERGHVRIGGTPFFMDGVVAPMIADFQRQFPDVRIVQSYGYQGDLATRLLTGSLDLAICPMAAGNGPEGLDFEPILPGVNVVACRSGHPLTRKGIITLQEIGGYPWIAPPPESPLYADLRNALAGIGMNVEIAFSGGSLSSVISMLSGTDALTVLPYSVVFLTRQREIRALSLRIAHPDRTLGLLYRSGEQSGPASERARRFLRARFTSLSQTIAQHQKNLVWRGA